MIPTAFVRLDALPRLANGKVDRKALPAPDTTRPDLADDYVAPRNSIEERIAALWAELLNVERIGINDNFFDLGGHSLLAAHVCSELSKRLNRHVPLLSMFKHPTVDAMARYLTSEPEEELPNEEIFERAEKQQQAIKRQRRAHRRRVKKDE
jgi:acyl carrier protein